MFKPMPWFSIASVVVLVAGACSTDDAAQPASDGTDQGGDSSMAGSGSTSLGGSSSTGGTGAGAAAGTPSWACDSGYDLPSYNGDQSGLCAANESRWIDCCTGPAADIADAIRTRCAPDGSACIADSYCTTYNTTTLECGWIVCDPDNQGATGGAGGAAGQECPWDKARAALDNAINNADSGPVPCAADVHCQKTHQVCNVRIANRMFCGNPGASGQGGSGG